MKALWVLMVLFAVTFAAWMVLDIDRSKDLRPPRRFVQRQPRP